MRTIAESSENILNGSLIGGTSEIIHMQKDLQNYLSIPKNNEVYCIVSDEINNPLLSSHTIIHRNYFGTYMKWIIDTTKKRFNG